MSRRVWSNGPGLSRISALRTATRTLVAPGMLGEGRALVKVGQD